MKKFKLLTIKEENQLSLEELKRYYEELRDYCYHRRLTNTTPGATTIAPNLKNPTNKTSDKLVDIIEKEEVIKICDGEENIPKGPVIYAHTHQGLLDNFAWIPATPDHAIILHSKKVKLALIIVQLNTGLVLVSKDKRQIKNIANAKLDMISLGLRGHSIAYFPEAAWRLSPNKLHLPKSFGVFDIARKANVPVIPVVDEYTYDSSTPKEKITKIHIRFGKPIYTSMTDNLSDKLREYDEQISTMCWDLIAEKGHFKRSEIDVMEYINYLKGNIRNLKLGGIDLDEERSTIFDSDNEFYKFHHINDVPYDEILAKYGYGKLLETEEVRRLKRINKIHNI